jgi:uncharacterized radical SAM superfamily Fe-S cluster-containing enzyme
MMKRSHTPIDGRPRFGKFLPGQHKPLMAMIEITDRCNLYCPVCFAKAAPIFGHNPYNVLHSKHILLFAKGFMDMDALDEERINKCRYAITCEDGVFSFCAYNNLYRLSDPQRVGSQASRTIFLPAK